MALTPKEIKEINRLLLRWYAKSARPLKIRERSDPYSVLIVEVMAQQTQISRVDQLAARFIHRFPTLAALANAETADVLEAWRGLGYNRRALLLHRTAQAALALGGLPATHEELQLLPGIGPYTARAVAAIAFGGREIPVDVNIARVVLRLMGEERLTPKPLQAAANEFGAQLKAGESGGWAQAAMDLASIYCHTNAPDCAACPLRASCASAGRVHVAAPAKRAAAQRFTSTRRWLRGRLLDELRDAGPRGAQVRGSRGEHGARAVTATIKQLRDEGLVEGLGGAVYRLPRRT
jgi:A/G-specific adenine glycosylase